MKKTLFLATTFFLISCGFSVAASNGTLSQIAPNWGSLFSQASGYVSGQINWVLQNNMGQWVAVQYYQAGGACSFNAYSVGTTGSLPSGNVGTLLQAALLDCQVKDLQLAGYNYGNELLEAQKLNFIIEPGTYQIGQTITIPNLLRVKNQAVFQVLHSGTASSPCNNTAGYFDGSACANLSATTVGPFIPAFIVAQGAETENLSVNAADPSSVSGTGVNYSGAWEAASVTVQATGSNYPNSFNASTNLVDKWGAVVNMACTASGGSVTGCSLTSGVRFNRNNGIFNLPPALQKTQWCNTNFMAAITAGGGTNAFDSNCQYYTTTTGGAGSGLTVSITWFPPYCTGSSGTGYASCTSSNLQEFLYSAIGAQTAEVQKYTHVTNSGNTLGNASYGDMYAIGVAAQNQDFLDMFAQGGGRSIWLTANATDNHILAAYAYAGAIGFTNAGTNNVWIGATSDSPTQTAFDFQKGSGSIQGLKLYTNSGGSTTTSNTLVFGDGNATWGPLQFNIASENSGAGSGAFASIDYMGNGNHLDFAVNNSSTNTSANAFTFGSHNTVNSSSRITGSFDGISAANFCLNSSNAVAAAINMNVWDAKDAEFIHTGCVPQSGDGTYLGKISGHYYLQPLGSLGTVTVATGGSTAYFTCQPRQFNPGDYISGVGWNITTNTALSSLGWHACYYPDLGHGQPDTQPLWYDLSGSVNATVSGAITSTTFNTGAGNPGTASTPVPWSWWWECLDTAALASGTLTITSSNPGSGSDIIVLAQFGSTGVLTTIPTTSGYQVSGITFGSYCPPTPMSSGTPTITTANLPLLSPKR